MARTTAAKNDTLANLGTLAQGSGTPFHPGFND